MNNTNGTLKFVLGVIKYNTSGDSIKVVYNMKEGSQQPESDYNWIPMIVAICLVFVLLSIMSIGIRYYLRKRRMLQV